MAEHLYDCELCGMVGLCQKRRKAHEAFWCESSASDSGRPQSQESHAIEAEADDDSCNRNSCSNRNSCRFSNITSNITKGISANKGNAPMGDETSAFKLAASIRKACMTPTFHSLVQITIADVPFRLELHNVFGPLNTAGGLWPLEVVVAQYIADRITHDEMPQQQHAHEDGWILELGSGCAPVAGFVAASFGWNVCFTDLKPILPALERNLAINHDAILNAVRIRADAEADVGAGCGSRAGYQRTDMRSRGDPKLEIHALHWGQKELPARIQELRPFIRLVICNDCIYQKKLLPLLVHTISQLLASDKQKQQDNSSRAERNEHNPEHLTACPVTVASSRYVLVGFQIREGVNGVWNEEKELEDQLEKYGLTKTTVPQQEVAGLLDKVRWPKRVSSSGSDSVGDPLDEKNINRGTGTQNSEFSQMNKDHAGIWSRLVRVTYKQPIIC